jgi:hypothetical protein
MVFNEEKTEKDFDSFNYKKINIDGRIITVSIKGDADETERHLMTMNPILIERFPLSLEEIFLEEMEGTDYDFKEIFG